MSESGNARAEPNIWFGNPITVLEELIGKLSAKDLQASTHNQRLGISSVSAVQVKPHHVKSKNRPTLKPNPSVPLPSVSLAPVSRTSFLYAVRGTLREAGIGR